MQPSQLNENTHSHIDFLSLRRLADRLHSAEAPDPHDDAHQLSTSEPPADATVGMSRPQDFVCIGGSRVVSCIS